MNYAIELSLYAAGLFVGMIVLLEVGRRLGTRRLAQDPNGATAGFGAVDSAVFALFGLLVAFTFSGATSRFDARRLQIVQEANTIGTAYLRIDLLPEAEQPALREMFRAYTDSRIETYRKLPDLSASLAELAHSQKLQSDIWRRAEAASRGPGLERVSLLLLPAINEMIDISTSRTVAGKTHPPQIIFFLLYALALGCALFVGYEMAGGRKRSWPHMIVFAAITSMTVFIILDVEHPRMGLLRLESVDQVMIELRAGMNS